MSTERERKQTRRDFSSFETNRSDRFQEFRETVAQLSSITEICFPST